MSPIVLITGPMAAGKSTVAQAVCERLPRSVHLRGDLFRRMVVNGRADMTPEPSPQALAQLDLRYRAAADTARLYSTAGFTVVYQDVILGPMLRAVVDRFDARTLHVIVLNPERATLRARERGRAKTGYSQISVDQMLAVVRDTPRLGTWLDNSNLSVDETVRRVLEIAGLA